MSAKLFRLSAFTSTAFLAPARGLQTAVEPKHTAASGALVDGVLAALRDGRPAAGAKQWSR